MIRRRLSPGLFALACALLPACGGFPRIPRFGNDWLDDHGASVDRVRAMLANTEIPDGSDVVVAVTGESDGVVGFDLASGTKWTFSHGLDARPAIVGHLVLLSGNREIVALDAESGKELWRRPTGGLAFLGAGDDGSVTMIALAQRGGRGSTLLALLHDGSIVRQIETTTQVGVPAVVHGHAFVPWAAQYVSVIDLSSGEEVARVVLREKVTRAWVSSRELFFGEIGFFRWDDHIRDASKGKGGATHVGIPGTALPGSPILMDPGNDPLAPVANARDSVRLYARPSMDGGEKLGLDHSTYYATYFKVVTGLDAKDGRVRFADVHEGADLVGGAAIPGGFLGCDADGKLFVLAADDGARAYDHDLGVPIRSCVIQTSGFHAPKAEASAPGAASQLAVVVRSGDLRLVPAQLFLLRDLAARKDEVATKALIEVASDPRAAPLLVADARALLAKRSNGASFIRAALQKKYDYLHDYLAAPPVGPLADAALLAKDRSAAPLLARQLLDPSSTIDDVRRAALALERLGTPSELHALQQFFAMNRAQTEDDDLAIACVAAGRALARIEPGEGGRGVVDRAIADGMSNPLLREQLSSAMRAVDDAAAKAAANEAAESTDAGVPNRPSSADAGAKRSPAK